MTRVTYIIRHSSGHRERFSKDSATIDDVKRLSGFAEAMNRSLAGTTRMFLIVEEVKSGA